MDRGLSKSVLKISTLYPHFLVRNWYAVPLAYKYPFFKKGAVLMRPALDPLILVYNWWCIPSGSKYPYMRGRDTYNLSSLPSLFGTKLLCSTLGSYVPLL